MINPKGKTFGFLVCLVLISASFAITHPAVAQNETPYDLINAVNDLRSSYGLQPYQIDPWLMAYAQEHADYIATRDEGTHVHSDGKLPWDIGLKEDVAGGDIGIVTVAVVVYEIWVDWGHLHPLIGYVDGEIGAGMAYSASDQVYYTLNVRAGAEVPTGIPGQVTATSAPFIPVVISTPDENGLIIHVVGYGQTLWSIAATYGVPIDEIRQLNGMVGDATIITVGQKLFIRKANGVGLAGTKEMPTNTPVKTNTPETRRITPSITTTRPGVAIDLPPEKRGFGIIIGIMTSIVGAIIIIGLSSRIRWKKSRKNKKNLVKAL